MVKFRKFKGCARQWYRQELAGIGSAWIRDDGAYLVRRVQVWTKRTKVWRWAAHLNDGSGNRVVAHYRTATQAARFTESFGAIYVKA